nr:MAG TPA: hypothetical protein [Caudoviricetes sp.]
MDTHGGLTTPSNPVYSRGISTTRSPQIPPGGHSQKKQEQERS